MVKTTEFEGIQNYVQNIALILSLWNGQDSYSILTSVSLSLN